MIYFIDKKNFRKFLEAGYERLSSHKEWVNNLNVFPVPDGDTGSNMTLTLQGALKDGDVIKNSLLSARGNSGIILSQFLRGILLKFNHKEKINTNEFAMALSRGEKYARKSIKQPVEGTILTVMRCISRYALKSSKKEKDFVNLFENLVREAKTSLLRTPDLLPILKDAGVVDAGGQGLVYIFEGVLSSLKRCEPEANEVPGVAERLDMWRPFASPNLVSATKGLLQSGRRMVQGLYEDLSSINTIWEKVLSPIKKHSIYNLPALRRFAIKLIDVWERKPRYRYDVECIVEGNNIPKEDIEKEVAEFGDSVLLVQTPNLVKLHIHTNTPETIFEIANRYGVVEERYVEDMEERQRRFILRREKENINLLQKIVTIVPGDGFSSIFKSMGAEVIKSISPSTQDILKHLDKVSFYFILPNSRDTLSACEQALSMAKSHGKVIPTKTLPEGVNAILAYNSELEPEENERNMKRTIPRVKSGEVSISVRNTTFRNTKIKNGDVISLFEDEVKPHKDTKEAISYLFQKMDKEGSETFTIFYGKKIKKREAESLLSIVKNKYPDKSIELYFGGQPHSLYIVGVE